MKDTDNFRELTADETASVFGGDESHYESGKRVGDKLEDIAEAIADAARDAANKIGEWFNKTF